jgi:hypothetical protein
MDILSWICLQGKQKNVVEKRRYAVVGRVKISRFVINLITNVLLIHAISGFEEIKNHKFSKQTDRNNFLSVCFLVCCGLNYIQLTLFPINCTVTSNFSVNFVNLKEDNG